MITGIGQVWNGKEHIDVPSEKLSYVVTPQHEFKLVLSSGIPEDYVPRGYHNGHIFYTPDNEYYEYIYGSKLDVVQGDKGPSGHKGERGVDGFDFDPINKPAHYNQGKIECIDAISVAVDKLEGMEAVYTANVIKYMWRWKHKNGVEDLKKAKQYLEWLIKKVENEG